MKNIIKCSSINLTFWLTLYLLGCFGNTEFNIKLWDQESRTFICIMAAIASIVSIVITYENKK